MNTWRYVLLIAVVIGAICTFSGCSQPFVLPEGYEQPLEDLSAAKSLENDSTGKLHRFPGSANSPATVLDPDRPAQYLSLAEAVALAMENGTVGLESVRVPGVANDDLGSFVGQGITSSDSIRVLAYQPARIGTLTEAGLARFDPLFTSGVSWRSTDEPTQGLASLSNGQGANLSTALVKPLSTGGVFGVSFNSDYQMLSNPPTGEFAPLSPAHSLRFQLGFEQPLLRNFGTDINQLRGGFPGSSLFPSLNGRSSSFASEGIVIARLRFDQSRAELERHMSFLVLNVHAAYWNLYGSYVGLYVNDQGLRQSHLAWRIGKDLMQEGKIDNGQLSQILAQYEQFRGDRMRALGRVLDAERNLRTLLGLSADDGTRLVPIDTPRTMPENPDWHAALRDCLDNRPELVLGRQEILVKEKNLLLQTNSLLPDLRFLATHSTYGLGSRLDGNGVIADANGDLVTNNALRSLASTRFNSWTVGLAMTVPLGYRYEFAQLRDARLAVAQSHFALRVNEQRATNFLAKQYSQVIETGRMIDVRKRQRIAQGVQVEVRFRKYVEGVKDSPFEFLLDAQKQWASSLNQEYQSIVDYNISLASFDFAKGALLKSCNVRIVEGALPDCVTMRAVDYERDSTRSRLVHERWLASKNAARPDAVATHVWPEHGAASISRIESELNDPRPLAKQADATSPSRSTVSPAQLLQPAGVNPVAVQDRSETTRALPLEQTPSAPSPRAHFGTPTAQ